MSDKLAGLLGLANRANKLIYGSKGIEAIADKNASLLLISDQASDRTMEKLKNRADYYGVEYLVIDDLTLNQSTGNYQKMHAVILDKGFAKGIKKEI